MELTDRQASFRRRKRINNGLPEFENGSELYKQLMLARNGDTSLWADPDVYKDDPYVREEFKPGVLKDPYIPQKNDKWKDSLPGIAKFAVDVYDAFQPSYKKNDLINNYGLTGSSSRYGIGYQTKTLDTDAANKNANANFWSKVLGTAASGWNAFSSLGMNLNTGSAQNSTQQLPKSKCGKLPHFSLGASTGLGIAGAIGGGILGTLGAGFARKKELDAQYDAQDYFNRLTTYNSNVAGTLGILLKYADENLDPTQLKLRFSCGKKPKFSLGKPFGKRVRSGFGFDSEGSDGLINAPLTGWANEGEQVNQYAPDGTLLGSHILPKTGNGTDTYPIYQDQYTEIIPTKVVDKMKKYKCGKLPKYDPGKNVNLASNNDNIFGTLAGLGVGFNLLVKSYEPTKRYYYDSRNQYLPAGMRMLNSLRVPDYPMEGKMSKIFAKNKYAVDNSGAAGGLRDMYNREAVNGLYNTYADMMMKNLMQNNAYKSDAAKTGIAAYAQEADRMQKGAIYADQLSDAAAANQWKIRQGAYANILSPIYKYLENKKELELFKLMYGNYSDDLDIRRKELAQRKAELDLARKGIGV